MDVNNIVVEMQVPSFSILPPTDDLSDFTYLSEWGSLADGLNAAVADPAILLDLYPLPLDSCLTLVDGITQGTASIVSNRFFNPILLLVLLVLLLLSLPLPLTVIPNFTPWVTTG